MATHDAEDTPRPGGQSGDPRIFISYRRRESSGYAGRLYDRLAARFGEGRVFMDVQMEPGVDYVETLESDVGACEALVALIGPEWLTLRDESGERRIDDPADLHRLEIEAALARNVRVIPALVGGAEMPRQRELPASLAPLARRQSLDLSDDRWHYDVGRLIDVLASLREPDAPVAPEPAAPRSVAPSPAPEPQERAHHAAPPAPVPSPEPAERPRGGGLRELFSRPGRAAAAAAVAALVVGGLALWIGGAFGGGEAFAFTGSVTDGKPVNGVLQGDDCQLDVSGIDLAAWQPALTDLDGTPHPGYKVIFELRAPGGQTAYLRPESEAPFTCNLSSRPGSRAWDTRCAYAEQAKSVSGGGVSLGSVPDGRYTLVAMALDTDGRRHTATQPIRIANGGQDCPG